MSPNTRFLIPTLVLALGCAPRPIPATPAPKPTFAAAVAPPVEAPPFERAAATEAGIDPAALEALKRRGGETDSDAIIVLRDGKLVLDERYGREDGRIETMSVSKSLVALAVGRLVESGKLASIDEPVHRFYPEWNQGKKKLVTVRHLLEMTSGLQADRVTREIYASPDFVKLALAAELTTDPGATFFYNNKAVNLLAGIVERASGKRLDAYAKAEVFGPLGIEDVGWELDKAGNPHAMSGIQLRPLDLARVGQMILDLGTWRGRRVVSEAWIGGMTTPGKAAHYGLLTWIDYESSMVVDQSVIDAWKKGGVDARFVKTLLPLKDRVFGPKEDFLGAVAATIGGDPKVALESWHDNTWRRSLPDGRAVDKRIVGARMDGYLGQYVVVVPEKRLVGVRMRRARAEGKDEPRNQFGDFKSRVRSLVP